MKEKMSRFAESCHMFAPISTSRAAIYQCEVSIIRVCDLYQSNQQRSDFCGHSATSSFFFNYDWSENCGFVQKEI